MTYDEMARKMAEHFRLRIQPDYGVSWRCDRKENPDFFVLENRWADAVWSYVEQAVNRAAGST